MKRLPVGGELRCEFPLLGRPGELLVGGQMLRDFGGMLETPLSGCRIAIKEGAHFEIVIEHVYLQLPHGRRAGPGDIGLRIHIITDDAQPAGGDDAEDDEQRGERAKAQPQRPPGAPRTQQQHNDSPRHHAEHARREHRETRRCVQRHGGEAGDAVEILRPERVAEQRDKADRPQAGRECLRPALRGPATQQPQGSAAEKEAHCRDR